MAAPSDPNLLWIGVIVGAIVMIAQAWPKVLGPIGESIRKWAKERRAAESEATAEEIADRDQTIAYLKGVAAERLREIRARDELAAQHAPWDWERYKAAIKAGHEVDPPPPLIPEIPPPPHGHGHPTD